MIFNKTIISLYLLIIVNIAFFSYHSFIYFNFSPPQGQIIMGDDYGVSDIVNNYLESYLAFAIAILATLALVIYFKKNKVMPYIIWFLLTAAYIIALILGILIDSKDFMLFFSLPIMSYPLYQVVRPILIHFCSSSIKSQQGSRRRTR